MTFNLKQHLSCTALIFACITFIFTEINLYSKNDNENCANEFNEKVYLQLHKNVFIAGDDIYYKAFIVNASTLRLSQKSKILYVEFLNPENRIVFSWIAKIVNGMVEGGVSLPDSLKGSLYTVRAYTNWMRNNSPNLFFSKYILITSIAEEDLNEIQIRNFNINNEMKPNNWDINNGISLNVVKINEQEIKINNNSGNFNSLKPLHLTGKIRGGTYINELVDFTRGDNELIFPVNTLSEGIVEFSLLDNTGFCFAEELYYLTGVKYGAINVKGLKTKYGKSENVSVELGTTDLNLHDTAILSLTITEKPPFDLIKYENINNYFNFYSDLNFIPDSQIFNNELNESQANQIIKTIPVNHYAWHISNNQYLEECSYLPEDKGFILEGRIVQRLTQKPLTNELVILTYPDSIPNMNYTFSDQEGKFYFLLKEAHNNKKLVLQVLSEENTADIEWTFDDKNGHDEFNGFRTYTFSPEELSYLENCRNIKLVNSVYRNQNNGAGKIEENKDLNGYSFYGKPELVVYPADFLELPDFKEITDNILPGVRFKTRHRGYSVQILNLNTKEFMPPLKWFLLNGVPFSDFAYLHSLGSSEIKKVEVVQSIAVLGELLFEGILSVQTYSGEIPESGLNGRSVKYNNIILPTLSYTENPFGLAKKEQVNVIPDFRQTLYWNPSIKLAADETKLIEFQTSDLVTKYYINIQGITISGKPISKIVEFQVK